MMKRLSLAVLLLALPALAAAGPSLPPPPVTPVRPVVDDYFGTKIVDPYRWLEDGKAPAVRDWSAKQNGYARRLLDSLPHRAAIRQELQQLFALDEITAPQPIGGRLFYTRRRAGQNQPVLYVRDRVKGAERTLVDPNKLSTEGSVALDWWYPSRDGAYVAYGVSANGDEQSTLHVLDVRTGARLAEAITRTRAVSVAWLPDSSGFYYTRFGASGTQTNVDRRIYLHKLGVNATGDGDRKIWGDGLPQADWPYEDLSRDGRWLLLFASHGSENSNDLQVRDLQHPEAPDLVVNRGGDTSWNGEVFGSTLYLLTNDGAPRYKVVAIDLLNPARDRWRTIVPEGAGRIQNMGVAADRLVLTVLESASSRLRMVAFAGGQPVDVPLPAIGTVEGVGADQTSSDVYYAFDSYNQPTLVERLDSTDAQTEWARVRAPFDPSSILVEQVTYPSKDGTPVSMFVVRRRDVARNGAAPLLLSGYGGFDIAITPTFNYTALAWAEYGGVYAVPNLRGGGEYGEAWHKAGMFERKQNVFDDFVYAARWLVAHKYASRKRVAINGGSNGGLLVAAAETQAPQLFRAVVCDVPLTDMLRYHKFLIARLWVSEYGSSDKQSQFAYLVKYSPYHNVRDGVRYPATMVTTSEDDSRVDPMNARKFAARLQAANAGPNPVILRVEPKAGHGAGTPVTKLIEERVDRLAFLLYFTR